MLERMLKSYWVFALCEFMLHPLNLVSHVSITSFCNLGIQAMCEHKKRVQK